MNCYNRERPELIPAPDSFPPPPLPPLLQRAGSPWPCAGRDTEHRIKPVHLSMAKRPLTGCTLPTLPSLGVDAVATTAAAASPARNRRILTEGRGGYSGKAPQNYGYSCYGAGSKPTGCYQGSHA